MTAVKERPWVAGLVLAIIAMTAFGCGKTGQSGTSAPQTDAKAVPSADQPPSASKPAPEVKIANALGLKSVAFKDGDRLPARYTEDGPNLSPPLQWNKPPEGTKEVAVCCDDPDAPSGSFSHWTLWGIPPGRTSLPENLPKTDTLGVLGGAKQGTSDFGKMGYWGPAPPPGKPHRYVFTVYALNAPLDVRPAAKHDVLIRVIEAHVIAKGQLTGTYGR